MTNRLIISNGPFTSLLSLSIFKNNYNHLDNTYLLGYFKNISEEHHGINSDIFIKNNVTITNIYSIFNYYKSYYKIKYLSKNLLANALPSNLDEVLIPINTKTTYWYYFFKKIMPHIKIILYEEGMFSYIKPIFSKKLKHIMKQTTNYYVIYHRDLANLLSYFVPQLNYQTINKECLLGVMDNYAKQINIKLPELDSKMKYALIVPQYYYEKNKKKYTDLINNYDEIIETLIQKGYKILLKDHPKGEKKLYNSLTCQNKISNIMELDPNYPIELMYPKLNINMVFSVYSTSLFSLNYLYNAQTFSSTKMINNRISAFSIFPSLTCSLANFSIPKIEDYFINNHYAIAIDRKYNHGIILKTQNIILNIFTNILKYIL